MARRFSPAARRARNRAARRRRLPPVTPQRSDRQVRRRWCSAIPKTAGRKSSPPTVAPIIRRGCVCSRAPSRRLAPSRGRPWGRSIARTIGASISTSPSSTICRTSSAPAPTARPASSREAYVIAHEVGHHVQNEIGILPRVMQEQQASTSSARDEPAAGTRRAAGGLSRRHLGESRADESTISSTPATSTRRCRPPPPSATTACKKQSQGYVVPDAFTHGTSQQRKRWFMSGFKEGKISRLRYDVRGAALVVSFSLVPASAGISESDGLRPPSWGERVQASIMLRKVYPCRESTTPSSSCRSRSRCSRFRHAQPQGRQVRRAFGTAHRRCRPLRCRAQHRDRTKSRPSARASKPGSPIR